MIFTIPQAIIFRVMKHPEKEFYQCTTYNFFEDLSTPGMVGNATQLLIAGLTPVDWADLYHTAFNCQVFFAPLIAICASKEVILSISFKYGKGLHNIHKHSFVYPTLCGVQSTQARKNYSDLNMS